MHQRIEILNTLKRIYRKKLDVVKIRVHGNYELPKILLTGKDLAIQDFSGKPAQPFSERRLKRSPLVDIASIIGSIHSTAYEGFLESYQIQKEEKDLLLPFAAQWAHYMSGFFMRAYLEKIGHTEFIPQENEDLKVLLHTFLLERALQSINFEIKHQPQLLIAPLRLIQSVLNQAPLQKQDSIQDWIA